MERATDGKEAREVVIKVPCECWMVLATVEPMGQANGKDPQDNTGTLEDGTACAE